MVLLYHVILYIIQNLTVNTNAMFNLFSAAILMQMKNKICFNL